MEELDELWVDRGGKKVTNSHNPDRWHLKLWRYYPINFSPEEYHDKTSWWLDKIPTLGDKILEVGFWSGLSLIWLKHHFPEKDVIGVDVNKFVIHYAKTRTYFFGLDIPLYVGDGFNLSAFTDSSKDVIFHDGLAEHFPEPERVKLLTEHLRVAKKVLFTVPTSACLQPGTGYGDEIPYTKDEWDNFVNKYFVVDETFSHDGCFGCVLSGTKPVDGQNLYSDDPIGVISTLEGEKMTHPEDYHFGRMKEALKERKFKKAMDVGCGDGYLSYTLKENYEEVVAFDVNEFKVKTANEQYEVPAYVLDLEKNNLPGWEGEYDLIVFCDVIYYLSNEAQKKVMVQIHERLSSDGVLLTSRHLGNGDAELDAYTDLFEKVSSEDVKNPTTHSVWRVSTWKKKCKKCCDDHKHEENPITCSGEPEETPKKQSVTEKHMGRGRPKKSFWSR